MVFFELTATRAFTVYGAQGILFAFLLFLAYKILKRDRKRLNIIFSLYYLFIVIGVLINFVYAPLEEDTLVRILNFLTNFFIFGASIFLVVFELILLKSEKFITLPKQLLIVLVYETAMFCMIFFVFVPEWGVTLNPTTYAHIWSIPF